MWNNHIPMAWETMLYPDPSFTKFIINGIKSGFRIGFNHNHHSLQSKLKNPKSAIEHTDVMDAYLQNEVSLDCVVCLPADCLPWFQPNAFGVIPRAHKPGKWRLIVDLSSPEFHSVSDFILKELVSISYISTDTIANTVILLGQGSLLAMADVKEAFRIIPVAPVDRLLLTMQWKGKLYTDKVLSFGLCSVPILFTAVSDTLKWILRSRGVSHIFHNVDDFIMVTLLSVRML